MFHFDLQKWPIFRLLETNFLSKIRMVFVYGPLGEEALIVTKDQDVYAVGSNTDSCLGIGHNLSTVYPRKIEILCGQGIKTFRCGNSLHVIALTNSGKVYSWGNNTQGQLGNGYVSSAVSFPVLIEGGIDNQSIVDIACGSYHSLALTSKGEVYAWGQNNYQQVGDEIHVQSTPRKVDFRQLTDQQVSCISCGAYSSMAVTHNGDVYGWGLNQNGQLGIGTNQNATKPTKITALNNIPIAKIVCGHSHALALSNTGDLYAWGKNCHGQLGAVNTGDVTVPRKIEVQEGSKTYDIAASHHDHISAAMIHGNQIFMWGECLAHSITVPKFVSVKYMDDVFAYYASHRITYQPIVCSEERSMNLEDCLREAFDNPAMSDLVINVRDQPIYVQKAVLRIRSEYFRNILKNNSSAETDTSIIQHSEFSYDVYKGFLKYLYTAEINLCIDDTIELLALANSYLESKLKESCISAIKAKVTIDNVATLCNVAVQYKSEELEKHCLRFMRNHMTAVVQTESFSKLDADTMKQLLIDAAKVGLFKT